MHAVIISLVKRNPCTLLNEIFASIKALSAIGKNNKGPYKLWNKLIIAKVFAGVRSLPIATYITKVAFKINIGLNQTDRILRQDIKNLVLSVFIS